MRYNHSEGVLVRIFMSEDDRYRGSRLYKLILDLAHDRHLAGATVIRGVEGFGASDTVHSERSIRSSEDLPIVITVADTREALEPFIDQVESIMAEAGVGGFMTIDRAELVCPGRRRGSPIDTQANLSARRADSRGRTLDPQR